MSKLVFKAEDDELEFNLKLFFDYLMSYYLKKDVLRISVAEEECFNDERIYNFKRVVINQKDIVDADRLGLPLWLPVKIEKKDLIVEVTTTAREP